MKTTLKYLENIKVDFEYSAQENIILVIHNSQELAEKGRLAPTDYELCRVYEHMVNRYIVGKYTDRAIAGPEHRENSVCLERVLY